MSVRAGGSFQILYLSKSNNTNIAKILHHKKTYSYKA